MSFTTLSIRAARAPEADAEATRGQKTSRRVAASRATTATISRMSPTGRSRGLTRPITAPTTPGGSLNHRNTATSAELGEPAAAIEAVTTRPTSPAEIATQGHRPGRRDPSVARTSMAITPGREYDTRIHDSGTRLP